MLRDRINAALGEAQEADDAVRSCVLRLIKAAIRDRDAALKADDGQGGLDDRAVMDMLERMVVQRKDSIRGYEQAGQMELAEQEQREIDVIREFLPRRLTREETEKAVQGAIAETNATTIRDMGKVMTVLKTRYPGRIDFCDAGACVKAALG